MTELMEFINDKGLLLSKDTITLLESNSEWKKILNQLIEEGHFIINIDLIEQKIQRTKLSGVVKEVEIKKTFFKAQAKDRPPNFRVMSEYDVSGQSNSKGTVGDFLKLFRNKFKLLSNMLRQRHNLTPVDLSYLKAVKKSDPVDVIGMVNKKWRTKNNHLGIEIEDLETKCIVLIMEKEKELLLKAEHILEDNVIAIKGVKFGEDFIIAKEIFWPDIPISAPRTITDEVYSGGTSDFHIGSNCFLEDATKKWIDYLNGKNLTAKQLDIVGKLQYLFVVGDNVSGVGVYPGQIDELTIVDIYKQYEAFEDIMLQIPEYIQVFICPGQHDAVRRAEPQPAISKEFMPRLDKLKNFHFISSPSWVETEGLKNLVYHGPSIHDLISSVSFLDMSKPQEGMVELLKQRDLMPRYGGRNPYVPEEKDYMAIKEVPDLVWIGDMHHNGYITYRGTTILNGGCWESQTDFQKKIGHVPTPGQFPIINLKTRKITEIYLMRDNLQKDVEAEVVGEENGQK
ncbi:MAG: metallophosphoesterase [Candidatus ainarchaeum sp.]|nr:metallophosphoesterase [Candidatus ainarchaeum sp.]